MRNKDRVAEDLIAEHFAVEPDLEVVFRPIGDNEDDPDEPIRLLEVNSGTLSTETFQAFGFAPSDEVPYPTLIAELTPDALSSFIRRGLLPDGWDLGRARTYYRPIAADDGTLTAAERERLHDSVDHAAADAAAGRTRSAADVLADLRQRR